MGKGANRGLLSGPQPVGGPAQPQQPGNMRMAWGPGSGPTTPQQQGYMNTVAPQPIQQPIQQPMQPRAGMPEEEEFLHSGMGPLGR